MKKLMVLAVLLLASNLYAMDITVGIMTGLTFTTTSGEGSGTEQPNNPVHSPVPTETSGFNVSPPGIDIFALFPIHDHFSLRAQLGWQLFLSRSETKSNPASGAPQTSHFSSQGPNNTIRLEPMAQVNFNIFYFALGPSFNLTFNRSRWENQAANPINDQESSSSDTTFSLTSVFEFGIKPQVGPGNLIIGIVGRGAFPNTFRIGYAMSLSAF